MIGFDFLNVIFYECLIILTIDLIRFEFAYHMVYIDQGSLGQPQWSYLFSQDVIEHQDQQTIAFDA